MVEDNGIGIASKFYDWIFGLFDRLHGQEVYLGTGIGLAIAKESIGWAARSGSNRLWEPGKITQLRVLKREVRQPIA